MAFEAVGDAPSTAIGSSQGRGWCLASFRNKLLSSGTAATVRFWLETNTRKP
jgi:hypothetical protein